MNNDPLCIEDSDPDCEKCPLYDTCMAAREFEEQELCEQYGEIEED